MCHFSEQIHHSKNDIKTFGIWKINNEIQRDRLPSIDTLAQHHRLSTTAKGWNNPYGLCKLGYFNRQHVSQPQM